MVPDHDADIVCISGLLPERHPSIADALQAALGNRLRTISGTKDIWCRDFMPVQVADNRFVQFRYDPDYLKLYPDVRTDNGAGLLSLTKQCVRSEMAIDGGNVVHWTDAAILTDKISQENPKVERPRLRGELRRLLEIERLVVIPKEPGDAIGHSDGMVRFVDEKTVLVNDYRRVDPAFGKRLAASLHKHGLNIVPFPYCPTGKIIEGIDSAVGVYVNFLQTNGMIFCPVFGQHEDDQVLNILSRCFPGDQIIPVPSNDLAAEGGVLNCATWNIKPESRRKCH